MNRYERRKFKANLYKHANTIMYVAIFVIAGAITIAAAINRTDNIAYVDESQIASSEKEAVDIKNSTTQKVASTETQSEIATEIDTTIAEPTVTEPETTEQVSTMRVKVTTETLFVRAQASGDSDIIGMVEIDSAYDVLSQNGEWIEIDYNGARGFINAEFTEVIE